MAEILPNQPIIFDNQESCWLEDCGIKVLAEYGDITQFQMGISPCMSDMEIIQDGNFPDATNWTLGTGWTISGGEACHAAGTYSTLYQDTEVSNGTLVKMQFTLDVGEIGCTVQFGDYIESFTESGTYTRWAVVYGANQFGIAANGSAVLCVSSVSVLTINTNFETWVVDSTGATVATLTDGVFADGFFTQSIDWETLALPNDCYTLQVFDPCPCSQGGILALDFVTGLHHWNLASEWLVSSGVASFSGSGFGVAELNHVICDGTSYDVTYEVTGLTGSVTAAIMLGSQVGTTRNADGIYTETIVANGTSFNMVGTPSSGTPSFEIIDVSIEITDKEATYESNVIKLSEEFSCKTLALSMCNDTDHLGFGFEQTGFRPLMRIPASMRLGQPVDERLAYDYSTGRKATYYGKMRVVYDLGFDAKPFMMSFAFLWNKADHFYIDDTEYFVEEDEFPSMSSDDNSDQIGVTIQVSVKTQLIENKRLSSSSSGCSPGGNEILDENGFKIVDEQFRVITDG